MYGVHGNTLGWLRSIPGRETKRGTEASSPKIPLTGLVVKSISQWSVDSIIPG